MEQSILWKFLIRLQQWILIACSIVVVLIMCMEALLRYVFHTDLYGIEEIVLIIAFWLYFIGSSYGSYDKSHVKADIIPRLLSGKKRLALSIFVSLVMAVLCFLFTYWSVGFVQYSIAEMPRTLAWGIPLAVAHSSVFLGYLLMAFYCSVYLVKEIISYRGQNKKTAGNTHMNE